MDPTENPDGGSGQWNSTPFGGDKNVKSHFQPCDVSQAAKVMPGEQPDPRFKGDPPATPL